MLVARASYPPDPFTDLQVQCSELLPTEGLEQFLEMSAVSGAKTLPPQTGLNAKRRTAQQKIWTIKTSDVLIIRMNELLYYDLKDGGGITPSLATQVCREIGRRIVAGHFRENDLIEDENRLAKRYGVSKSVIREAVKLLSGKGLLEVRRGSGTRVRPRASWAFLDDDVMAWHLAVDAKPEFLRQLMDIRRMMEPRAAAWAAAHGTDAAIDAVRLAYERMEEEMRSVEEFVVADALFHRAVLRAANNEILNAMEGVIFSAMISSIKLTNADPRENEESIPFHREVMEAIANHNPKLAEEKMSRLLDDASDRLTEAADGYSRRDSVY